jgi:hypothetical protein
MRLQAFRLDLSAQNSRGAGPEIRQVLVQERDDPAFVERSARVADVQVRLSRPLRRRPLQNGVGGVLNDLEDQPVAIAAGEHRLFGAEVLSDELRFDPVDLEDVVAIRLQRMCSVRLHDSSDRIGAPGRIEAPMATCEPQGRGAPLEFAKPRGRVVRFPLLFLPP